MIIDLNGHQILRQSTINLVFRLQTLPDLGNRYVPDCPAQVELWANRNYIHTTTSSRNPKSFEFWPYITKLVDTNVSGKYNDSISYSEDGGSKQLPPKLL